MFRHILDVDYINNVPHLRLDGFDPIPINEKVHSALKDLIIEIFEKGAEEERKKIQEYMFEVAQRESHSATVQNVIAELSDMIRNHAN